MENQKILLSSENVFDERYNKFINSRRAVTLQNKFKDKSFDERTKKFAFVALVLSLGSTLFSAFSAHFYLLNIFNALGSFSISIILTVIVIGCLEYGKRDSLPQFFKAWFQYKKFDTVNFSIGIGLMALSIGSSFLGSHLIPSQLAASPTTISIDSVSSKYDALILAKNKEAESYFNANNWKGRLDGSSRPTYNKLLSAKSTLEKNKAEAIKEAEASNKQTMIDHENKMESQGVQLGYITLGSELLLILLMGFIEYRDYRAVSQFAHIQNYESNDVEVKEVTTKIVNNTNSHDESRQDENRRVSEKTKPIQVSELRENTPKRKGIVNCKHCSKEYVKNHHKQLYCSDNCRKLAYEKRTGKKFYIKSTS